MAHDQGPGPLDPGFDPADPEYGVTPEGSTYEHTDAHVWIIAKFIFWLAVTALLTHIGLGFMYQMLIEQGARREEGEIQYPLAAGQEQRLPPAPRLQQSPSNEIYDFRRGQQDLLDGYGWQNRAQGTVRIPISEAMRLTVERGLPSRPTDTAQPAETPGLYPSDASSGRMMERRRQ
jgi:hypothetical protein